MTPDALLQLGREALWLMVLASLPPVLASLVVGLLSSVLQAATQIQETTLSVVPKLAASLLALAVTAPWIGEQLTRFTAQLLQLLPGLSS